MAMIMVMTMTMMTTMTMMKPVFLMMVMMMIPSASGRVASGQQGTQRRGALGEQTGSGINGTPSRSRRDGSGSSNLIESSEREIVKDGNGEETFSGRHGRARENNTRFSRE
eukprot:2108459-Pyramimonas_sp.AAC.1